MCVCLCVCDGEITCPIMLIQYKTPQDNNQSAPYGVDMSLLHVQACTHTQMTDLTWDTWVASSKKRFISSSPYTTFIAEPLVRCKREREWGRKNKRPQERKRSKQTGEHTSFKWSFKDSLSLHCITITIGNKVWKQSNWEREGENREELLFRSKSTPGC